MTKTSILWQRMMAAARHAAARHGWRRAAQVRRAWTEWYYRSITPPRLKAKEWPELIIRD